MKTPARVFISYSHKDAALHEALLTQLDPLKREGVIDTWHDGRIAAGEARDQQINQHLEEADLVLMLISPDFLASDYLHDVVVQRALQRHDQRSCHVVPIIARPADFERTRFGQLQALPRNAKPVTTWANRDEAWLDVARGIREATHSMPARPSPAPAAPAAAAPATPASATAGRTPTPASLRKLLLKVFETDEDLNSFVQDYFKAIAQRFTGGMDRVQKYNLLLQLADHRRILAVLLEEHPDLKGHGDLLRYE